MRSCLNPSPQSDTEAPSRFDSGTNRTMTSVFAKAPRESCAVGTGTPLIGRSSPTPPGNSRVARNSSVSEFAGMSTSKGTEFDLEKTVGRPLDGISA